MGTTQRIIPGVTGEPNWSNLSNALTALANTVEKEVEVADQTEKIKKKEEANPSETNEKEIEKLNRLQIKLQTRRKSHYDSAFKNLVRTGGGRESITKGRSASLGRAGLRASYRIAGFVLDVYSNGLDAALAKIGFGPLTGKRVTEIIDFLQIYFADVSAGMDDVAANMASCQVLQSLSENINTVKEFEDKLNDLVDTNRLTELFCQFYGIYLFEHLSQRFQEKITQLKGEVISRETFNMIREDIIEQVKDISKEKSLSDINWKGQEGRAIQEKIFNSIIKIFE